MKCYDQNNTPLNVGDAVMYININNGRENEGMILQLLPNNEIIIDGETGTITVNASDVFYLPN